LLVVAAAGGAAAHGVGSNAGLPGKIVFSSDRAPDLVPQLFTVGRDGTGREQLSAWSSTLAYIALSPARTRVAFVLDGALEVANADGSDARQVTDPSLRATYPAWSPDGSQLAFRDGGGGLELVPAAGGAPRQLAKVAATTWPSWSPDGKQIAFSADSWPTPQIDAVTVADGTVRTIVLTGGSASAPAWSPDGKRIAYTVGPLWIVNADGSDATQLTQDYAERPVFSPDSKRVAFAAYGSNGLEVRTIGVDGSSPLSLTSPEESSYALSPAWSPDGSRIAFAESESRVVTVAAGGGDEQVVFDGGPGASVDGGPWWTPDGAGLLVVEHRTWNDRELYSTNGVGQPVVQLTRNTVDDADPAVSPDGQLIAFDRGRAGSQELYVMRMDGSGLRRLTTNRFVADVQPAWSPDGTELAFASDRSGRMHIYVMGSNGGPARRVTGGVATDGQPAWSPDGSWIAFTSTSPDGSTRQIWAVRPNGKGLRRLDRANGATGPAWSPTGARLAYLAREPGAPPDDSRLGLFVQDGNRTEERARAAVSRPAWSPVPASLMFSTGSQIMATTPSGWSTWAETDPAPGTTDEPAAQRRCDITGTAGNDVIHGTAGEEVICGLGGNDVIYGGRGDDVLLGGDGNDTLHGGAGLDLLFGGRGDDRLVARDGAHDVVDGGPGRDRAVVDRRDGVRSVEAG
jgi:Tol biopolymer transport system component